MLAKLANGQRCRLLHDRVIMRVKFEATDATGKVHKRSSMSHIYSHCVVIHFAAYPPSTLWPKGIAACSHAEWVGKRGKCDAIPEGQEPRAGKLLPARAN